MSTSPPPDRIAEIEGAGRLLPATLKLQQVCEASYDDLELNIRVPFDPETARLLGRSVAAWITSVIDALPKLNVEQFPISYSVDRARVRSSGLRLVDDYNIYALVADHFGDPAVVRRREADSTVIASAEIDVVASRSIELRKQTLDFLDDLRLLLSGVPNS